MFEIRKATNQDYLHMQVLLEETGLYKRPQEIDFSHFFVIAEQRTKKIMGMIGLEQMENIGQLRSFVLQKEAAQPALIIQLIQAMLIYAGQSGINKLYLSTTWGQELFTQIGFQTVPDHELPEQMKLNSLYQPQVIAMVYTDFVG